MSDKTIDVKVAEALQNDVGRGIVRIDSAAAKKIDATTGDIVEITGGKTTAAKLWQTRAEDEGRGIIRMDGLIRQNSDSSLGDKVKIRKADVSDAKKIIISPTQHEIRSDENFPVFVRNKVLLGKPVVAGDIFYLPGLGGQNISFTVASTKPKGVVKITEDTEVEAKSKPVEVTELSVNEVRYEDIGGLKDEVGRVREMIELPMKHPELFEKIGINPPKGVLLYGPPGTGKTLLAKAVATESNANFLHLNGPEIMDKYYGESERKLREIFDEAQQNAPSIIFIDEIDSIASKRDDTKGEVERRVVAQLLALMDGLVTRSEVIVVAATNRPDSLDPALRRPGRFDREIEIGVPDRNGRKEVLQIHTRGMPLFTWDGKIAAKLLEERIKSHKEKLKIKDEKSAVEQIVKEINELVKQKGAINPEDISILFASRKEGDEVVKLEKTLWEAGILSKEYINQVVSGSCENMINHIADITHGFVGADLSAVAREAAMHSLKRALPKIDLDDEVIPTEVLESLKVTKEDFDNALKVVEPSALREVYVEIPDVRWDEVGGLDKVKQDLIESIEWPLTKPDSFKKLGIKPPKAVLLYGPSGCGKTLLAKAVATETQSNFISIKGPELLSKWVGESEKGVREMFKKARQTAPTIIFFDEIDAIAPRRGAHSGSHVTETVVNQILTELDGIERLENVMIVGATNRPDILDPSLLRPGRFDRMLLVPLPDEKARHSILKVHSKGMPLKDVNVEELAKKTEGYSGADLEALCREAAMNALREEETPKYVTSEHFRKALDDVKPSVTEMDAKSYQKNLRKTGKDDKVAGYY